MFIVIVIEQGKLDRFGINLLVLTAYCPFSVKRFDVYVGWEKPPHKNQKYFLSGLPVAL